MCVSQASTRLYVGLLTCVFLLTCSTRLLAAAAQVFVANNGTDTASCGAQDHPCRSITRGIANVSAGGTVVVSPGRYGDLNSDGKFDYPGEEHPQSISYTPPVGGLPIELRCMICITKPLRLLSRSGAESTVIDAGHAPYNAIEIATGNVTIGDTGRGFTFMNAADSDSSDGGRGLGGNGLMLWGGPARITGNVATNNQACGFALVPGGFGVNRAPSNFLGDGPVTATDNTAIANGCGFDMESWASAVSLSNAVALGNQGVGLILSGDKSHSVTGSKSSGNGSGVSMEGGSFRLAHNYFVANRGPGVNVLADNLDVYYVDANNINLNSIIGNDIGVTVDHSSVSIIVTKNNIYGNGTDGSNCGIAVELHGVGAANNYWGSPKGPGPDPADWWGQEPLCNESIPNNDAAVFATPFSKVPFVIN